MELVEQVGIRLPRGTKERIQRVAHIDGRTMSNWIVRAIRDALKVAEELAETDRPVQIRLRKS
jgi:predicted DNA-binding protein